ncbi:ABC transporter family protein [Mycobacterium xenopi 3993]|nr:ABC transporter family protein [Mycobacterium xenopi 3993]
MPQDPLLFPHLSVAANVAFGLRHSGRRGWRGLRRRCRESARRWLREVDAEELADRRPRQLSGGQAQRVAIARALAAEPDALLLDEPLAGLDVGAAGAVRAVLRKVVSRDARATVLVTHDLLDVFTLADRVLVLESGRVAETGPVADVLTAPRSHFGARIAGVNLVNGTIGPTGHCMRDPVRSGRARRLRISPVGRLRWLCSRLLRWPCIGKRHTAVPATQWK